jgi:hypothetical protein
MSEMVVTIPMQTLGHTFYLSDRKSTRQGPLAKARAVAAVHLWGIRRLERLARDAGASLIVQRGYVNIETEYDASLRTTKIVAFADYGLLVAAGAAPSQVIFVDPAAIRVLR